MYMESNKFYLHLIFLFFFFANLQLTNWFLQKRIFHFLKSEKIMERLLRRKKSQN